MRRLSIALLIAAIATPTLATEARLAKNGLRVAFSDNQFEVFTKAGWTRASLFCAAGQVARISGAAANDYLVVTRGVTTSETLPNRRSALFELVDRSEVDTRSQFQVLTGFQPGQRSSVGAAAFACEQETFLFRGF